MAAQRISLLWLLACLLVGGRAAAQPDRPVLRLLVLAGDERAAAPAKNSGVDDTAVPLLATRPGRTLTAAFVGRRLDDVLMADITTRLRGYYVSVGRPFVQISIPRQDVAAGVLRVNIIETKLGRITVEGNRWFGDRQYLGAIRTQPGDPLDTTSLAADTDWINREGHRHASIAVSPGADPYTYDLTVRAKDTLPLAVTVSADNSGTADTGLYHVGVGLDWSNAFWGGDDLSYGFLTSLDGFRLLEHALSYTTYLPWRDSLTVSGFVADTRPYSTSSEPMHGHSGGISFRYSIALPAAANYTQHIDLGYDFKSTNANILSDGSSVFPTTSQLNQFVLSYGLRRSDTLGLTGLTMTMVASPGYLTALNTAAALSAQQPGASPSYVYGRLHIDRQTNVSSSIVWGTSLTSQLSSQNLLPSEQLEFGGIQSVRGFMEYGAARDNGIVVQNELRFPQINPASLWRGANPLGTVVPFVFLDLGAGRNHQDVAGLRNSWLEMASSGPGLAWQITREAAFRLSWGFPLIRNGQTGPLLGLQFGMLVTF